MQVGPDRIPALQLAAYAVDARLVVALLLKCAEQVIPEQEDSHIVLVQVDIVLRVMHAVIGGRLDPAVENAQPADQARVGPELIKELNHAGQQEDADGNAAQGHRHVEDPVGERAGSRLAQRRGEVEFLALMMHGVRGPKQTHGVTQAVLPVVAEIVKDEREDPGEPVARGEVDRSGVQQQPLIDEEAQEAEEHAHAGADDAATQAVDGVGEVVVAGSRGRGR